MLTWLNRGKSPSVGGTFEPTATCAENSKDDPDNQGADAQPV